MRAPPTPPLGWPTSPSGNSSSCRSTTTGSGTATTGCSPRRWWPSCTDGNRGRSHGSTCGPPRGTSSREWSRRPSRTVSPAGSGTAARLVDEHGTEYIGDRSDRHRPAVGAGARAGHASRLPASCRDCGLDGGALGGDRARAPPAADRRACVVPWPVAQRSCVAGRGDVTPARHDGSTGRRSGARRRPARARSRTAWQRWNALSATVLGVALLLRGDPEGDRAVRVRHAARPEARESARRGLGTAVRHYFRVPPTAIPWLAAQAAVAAPARSGCCPAELTSLR